MSNFNISAQNLNGEFNIVIDLNNIPQEKIGEVVNVLSLGFREIEVINSETGEVALTHYVGYDFFEAEMTEGDAIEAAKSLLKKQEEVEVPEWITRLMSWCQEHIDEMESSMWEVE